MSLWSALCSFFGFGKKPKSPQEEYEELERWINSTDYFDLCQKRAYQAVRKKDSLQPGQVHSNEGQIFIDCLKVDSALTRYQSGLLTEQFGEAKYAAEFLSSGVTTQLNDFSATGTLNRIAGEVAQKTPATENLIARLEAAKRELHIFKGAHGINREAENPERSNILYYMGAFAIAEVFANIVFLREAFDPVYGFFIALIVALLNLVGSAWFGYQFREKNHTDPIHSRRGQRNALYATAIILFSNATIAAFRLLAAPNSDMGFWLESSLLFVLGSGLGYAAFQKAYRLDDPFPGFGALSRKVDELELELQKVREEHAAFVRDVKIRALEEHTSLEKRIATSYQQFVGKLPEIKKILEVWERKRDELNQRSESLQTAFKAIVINNIDQAQNYPREVRRLPVDQILSTSQEQISLHGQERPALDRKAQDIQNTIQASRAELEKWFKSNEANRLIGWPTK